MDNGEEAAVSRWAPGDQITLRYVGHSDVRVPGRPGLLQGWPYVVVEDTPERLALWMPVGARMKLVDRVPLAGPLSCWYASPIMSGQSRSFVIEVSRRQPSSGGVLAC